MFCTAIDLEIRLRVWIDKGGTIVMVKLILRVFESIA